MSRTRSALLTLIMSMRRSRLSTRKSPKRLNKRLSHPKILQIKMGRVKDLDKRGMLKPKR